MKPRRKLMSISSTQQYLPVLEVRDDIVITKDGSYVKLMEFSPINFELRSNAEQEQIVSAFGSALRTWPKNTHIKIMTTPSNVSDFIREIEECMAEEESPECRKLQEDQIEMLKKISESQGITRRFLVSFPYEDTGGFRTTPGFREIKAALDKEGRNIRASLEACGNSLISAESRDYVLSALYTAVCKGQSDVISWEERKAYVEDRYRETYGDDVSTARIPAADYFAPERIDSRVSLSYMVVDGKYTMHCFLPSDAYPVRAAAGWLQVLFSCMDNVYVDFWIRKENAREIQPRLQFILKNNKIKAKNTDDVSLDYEDIEASVNAGYYIKSALAGGDDFCYISSMVTLFADSHEELMDRYREMSDYCIRNDMRLKIAAAQQSEAFLACVPVSRCDKGIFRKSRRNIMAAQLGSCYPFTAYELCDKGGVFLGVNARYGSPVFVNLFNSQRYQNANMLVLGPSGSGKTYSLLLMLLRMRQKGIQIFVVAPLKGHEFYRACCAVGGEVIRIAPGSSQNINIMEIRPKNTSDSELIDGGIGAMKSSILARKIQQLHRFFSLIIPEMGAVEKQVLDEALMKTYTRFGITTNNKSLSDPVHRGRYRRMPTLGDLYDTLQKLGSQDAQRIASVLSRFVTGSAKSFNLETNVNLDNRFVVVDVSDLTEELLPMGMFIALDYILDKAEADRTTNKVIAVDEMWKLMKASKLSAEFVVEIFKIIRGYAGSAIGATQDLDDVLSNEYGAAIINNTKTKLLLPMDKKEADAVASCIELTAEEQKQLRRTEAQDNATGRRKPTKALMAANTNHIFISIQASAKEHDLITTSAEDLRRIKDGKNVS